MAEQHPNPQSDENQQLDSEGIPDLEGALESKEITGDDQEGIVAPREYPQAIRRINRRDSLDQRLNEEEPDVLAQGDPRLEPGLMDPGATQEDRDAEMSGVAGDEGGAPSAEEAAIRVRKHAPGGTEGDRDSYPEEPVE